MLKTETNSKNSIRDMQSYLSTENGLAQLKAVYKKTQRMYTGIILIINSQMLQL